MQDNNQDGNEQDDGNRQIEHRARARQIIDFSGVKLPHQSKRRPFAATDADGIYDHYGDAFVFVEVKYNDAPLTVGQEITFKRLVDHLTLPAIFVLARHYVHDPEEDAKMEEAIVERIYYKKFGNVRARWVTDNVAGRLFPDVVDVFIEGIKAGDK